MSKSEQFAFPVECHGDKFTCRKTPVIPNLIDVDLAYHDTVLVEGKKHIRHLMHVYYMYSDDKMLKCDFFVEVDHDNIASEMLKVLKNYATHVCRHHKKRHFFSHAQELMSLSNIKFDKAVYSRDFNSREEMAQDLTKYLEDKKLAEKLTKFLTDKSSSTSSDLFSAQLRALLQVFKDRNVPDPLLVGVETNPGPPPDLRPSVVSRFGGTGYLFCGCAQDALGRIVSLCVTHANYLAEHADDMESSDESDVESPEDDVPDEPLVGIEPNPGPDLVNLTPSFALHGNYVGPGHTGGKKLGDIDWSTKPVDALDEAARNHDWHYSQQPANRGAADEVLAKRAWRSIAKQNSLTGKAKAAFVAVGMKAMSLIGSRNGTLLLDAPPPEKILPENRHRLPKDFTSRKRKVSQINGNNGSASNTDDVKNWMKSDAALEKEHWTLQPIGKSTKKSQINGNNGSATNLDDVSKGQKKNKRPKQKKSAGKKQKQPSDGKKSGGNNAIVQGFMPSTMNSQADIKPYYTVVKSTKGSRTIKTLFSVGTVGGIGPSSGGAYLNGGVIFSQVIDKSLFMGQVAEKDFDSYEQWQIKMAKRHFLPSVGSNTPGSVWFFPDPDAIDILTLGDTLNPQTLNGHKFAAKHTLWAGLSSGPLNVNKKQLYTDIENIEFSNINPKYNALSSSENRLYAAGIFTMLNGDGIPTTQTTSFGELFVEFEITFTSSQNADTSKLLAQVKASGRNTNVIPGLGSTTSGNAYEPIGTVINNSAATSTVTAAIEYIYNPNYFNPATGQFSLPLGTYQILVMMNVSTSPTVSATVGAIGVTNGVGTVLAQCMYEASDQFGGTTTGCEFSTGYQTNVTSASNGLILLGLLRITQVTAGNRAGVTVTFTNTFTGALSISSLHAIAIRMPEFDTLPLAMFAPVGAGGVNPILKNKQIRLSSNNPDENPIVILDGVPPDDEVYYLHKMLREYPHLRSYKIFESTTSKLEKRYYADRDVKDVNKFQDEEKKVKQYSPWEVMDETAASIPETPEIVDDPLSRSIHLQPNVAARLLSLVGAKAA